MSRHEIKVLVYFVLLGSSDDKTMDLSVKEQPNKSMAEIATEWIWNAYKKSQEQGVSC